MCLFVLGLHMRQQRSTAENLELLMQKYICSLFMLARRRTCAMVLIGFLNLDTVIQGSQNSLRREEMYLNTFKTFTWKIYLTNIQVYVKIIVMPFENWTEGPIIHCVVKIIIMAFENRTEGPIIYYVILIRAVLFIVPLPTDHSINR
jgi:hypothetical protein